MSQVPATLPVTPAHGLQRRPAENAWLIDQLWGEEAVGILGGEPKTCKSIFSLHLAVAVASGVPCMHRFAVARPGPVLVYAAEDAEHMVCERVHRIAAGAGVDLTRVPLSFITATSLRLDRREDGVALDATVAAFKPRLLILDPFVRLHRKDENVAGEIAPILADLRTIQRQHHTAIIVVHHARKGGGTRAGQALRGSSEFHAWGDSNRFLRRAEKILTLSIEHRAAPEPDDLPLQLHQDEASLQLRLLQPDEASEDGEPTDHRARILMHLRSSPGPCSRHELRQALGIRNATLGAVLATLHHDGLIARRDDGSVCMGTTRADLPQGA